MGLMRAKDFTFVLAAGAQRQGHKVLRYTAKIHGAHCCFDPSGQNSGGLVSRSDLGPGPGTLQPKEPKRLTAIFLSDINDVVGDLTREIWVGNE